MQLWVTLLWSFLSFFPLLYDFRRSYPRRHYKNILREGLKIFTFCGLTYYRMVACCDMCLILTLFFLKLEFVFGSLFIFSTPGNVTVQGHLLWFKIMMSVINLGNMLWLKCLLILAGAEESLLKKQYDLFFEDLNVELIRAPSVGLSVFSWAKQSS